jgi:hypothetical protein
MIIDYINISFSLLFSRICVCSSSYSWISKFNLLNHNYNLNAVQFCYFFRHFATFPMNPCITIRTIEINHHGNSSLLVIHFLSLEITCFGLVQNVKDCLIYTYLHKQHHLLTLSLLNIIERIY